MIYFPTPALVFLPNMRYSANMGEGVEFNVSAFKHGITEENIRYVLNHPQYEGPLEDNEDKYIIVGFDNSSNLLEILYNIIDDKTINVFHAMKCRSMFFHLLDT
jgi:hypothetical protein